MNAPTHTVGVARTGFEGAEGSDGGSGGAQWVWQEHRGSAHPEVLQPRRRTGRHGNHTSLCCIIIHVQLSCDVYSILPFECHNVIQVFSYTLVYLDIRTHVHVHACN